MATTTIKLENGVTINFDGTPSQEDIDEVADIHGGGMLSPKDKGYQNEVLVRKAAIHNGVDPDLGSALAKQESGFNPNASSGVAYGLTQITPDTARTYGLKGSDQEIIQQLNDPDINANLGMKILGSHLEKYGNLNDSLIAYNAGPGRVGQRNLPDETINYVNSINGMLGNRGTDKWSSSSAPDTKDWMSNPPKGSQGDLINQQLRYGATPNSQGSYIQNQIPRYDNPYAEDFTKPIPQEQVESQEQPQQQDQGTQTPPDNMPIPQQALNTANQFYSDINAITSKSYQNRPNDRSWFERTFYPESVNSQVADTAQAQNNLYSGMQLNPLEVPRIGATAVWDTAAGTQNLGLATDAYVGGKLGLNNGTYVPVPMLAQAHPEYAPQTRAGTVAAEILPYFTPGLGEEQASIKVASLADKAVPVLEKAYQNLFVKAPEVIGKNAVQSLPGSISGTSTPEEFYDKWKTNIMIGAGADTGVGVAKSIFKPGSEARRARIQEANANYATNHIPEEQLDMMHPYDENLGAGYNQYVKEQREKILRDSPNFSPDEFVKSMQGDSKWKMIAPDLSKFKQTELGMSKFDYFVSSVGSKIEKLVPGMHTIRDLSEMTSPKAGTIPISAWDIAYSILGIAKIPVFFKHMYFSVPVAGLKQFIDHMHIRDMKRVSGVKVSGDVLRNNIATGIESARPLAGRVAMAEGQGIPDYLTGKKNTLAQY